MVPLTKINWESADEQSIKKYLNNSDKVLSEINIPVDAICCRDLRCQEPAHHDRALQFYQDITSNLSKSSNHMLKGQKNYKNRPGWSDHVADLCKYTRKIRQMWIENGSS